MNASLGRAEGRLIAIMAESSEHERRTAAALVAAIRWYLGLNIKDRNSENIFFVVFVLIAYAILECA